MEDRLCGWGDISEVVLFGWGKYGQMAARYINKTVKIVAIIDNNPDMEGVEYNGVKVLPLSKQPKEVLQNKIIVSTHTKAYASISKTLLQSGLKENVDYCKLEVFLVEWFWRYRNKINVLEIHTTVTTKCTLNCKNCNMFMPYYKEPQDIPVSQLKDEIDVLFNQVDYIFNYAFLGGEPLLHPELPEYLEYVGMNYGDRIGRIGIITNGTILPNEKLLNVIKKYNIEIDISDYTNTIPYKKKLSELIDILIKHNIKHKVYSSLKWLDFGFPEKPFNYTNVREHMLTCGPIFHGYNDYKLFFCHIVWSAEKCGLYKLQEGDYLDVLKVKKDDYLSREKLAKYSLGQWDSGQVSMCRFCGGCGSDNNVEVDVAVQKPR